MGDRGDIVRRLVARTISQLSSAVELTTAPFRTHCQLAQVASAWPTLCKR